MSPGFYIAGGFWLACAAWILWELYHAPVRDDLDENLQQRPVARADRCARVESLSDYRHRRGDCPR